MKKKLKIKLYRQAHKLGKDWDGDIIKYRGKWYRFNIFANKVKEIKNPF